MSTRISSSSFEFSTLIDLLHWRTSHQPDQWLYTFLTDGESGRDHLTFAELERQARRIAAALQDAHVGAGERALLIYPSGLDFIAAFFGCLYSGIIAVPVYPPSAARSDRTLTKFRAIAENAQPAVVLTTSALSSRAENLRVQTPALQAARVIVTSEIPAGLEEQWRAPAINSDTLAFLQYTSGSTGIPKGVMVTHGNLLHNSALVARYCQHPADAHIVTWLPLYHDLGLIGGILQPLYAGIESTILTPAAFLQRPFRWLQAVSQTRATLSGGPNFAYDLCVRKISEEQKATLDLSNWQTVANGAEPVRAETMERFSQAFASCGFQRNNFYPCYGLAEATLVVSAGKKGVYPTIGTFQGRALEQNRIVEATPDEKDARTIVSIGHPYQEVVIADPDTLTRNVEQQVGEIWVTSPSVTQGYWKRPEDTASTFGVHLASGEGPFLRTGDLGFIKDGELFITGRLKDLIIIRGSNHYPQDIEQTVEKSHAALRANCSAAFSVDIAGEEQLVIVSEVERQYLNTDLAPVVANIRQAIAEQHELQTSVIQLIKTGSLPKTSSGKVQHRGTREAFLDGQLDVVYEWKLDDHQETVAQPHAAEAEAATPVTRPPEKKAREIQSWLISHISQALKIPVRDIDVQEPFAHYGMDSAQAISLSADLEDWLEREFSPTLVYDYPSIELLARYLAGESASPDPASSNEVQQNEPIAIVGLGNRFPGSDGPEEFWQFLRNSGDGISEVPATRWSKQAFYDAKQDIPGKMNTQWGGFLEHVDQFDPYFFGISPREASRMDPQQRLLLEVAWETLENAGVAPERLAGSQTGVFVGISSTDYSQIQNSDPRYIDAYAGTGNAHSIAANRISYILDLRGPSMAIDTACSSSLLAIHLACQSLRTGECQQALAGGVNLTLTPELTIAFSQAHMMSAVGHCNTFDEAADGYVRGEGCGLVLLKPLSAAQRDGDTILAIIRGSATNQDGRSNGLTAPNGPSQEAVIRQALRNAGVSADQISYVETHGSSTPLGDPIEIDALKAVLMQNRSPEQICWLGSVKTNIGHLESAAGIAGLIKTVLSLSRGEIAPHLHFKKLNPHISFDGTTFAIPTERQPWPQVARRLAGVSAFGFGGTNVHIILEAAPAHQPVANSGERPQHLLTLSARSANALQALAQRYERFLTLHPAASLADISFTANTGRARFAHRLAVLATSPVQLRERLADFALRQTASGVYHEHIQQRGRKKVAFLFTGQGSQYIGMGRQLYETQPTFRKALDRCDQILRPYLKQSLLSVLYPETGVASPLDETAFTQPALFALEYALAEMWLSWGIEPDVVIGHSVGEYVAACVAGLFSLEDGLRLIAERGRLMQELPQQGEMAVIFADQATVAAAIAPMQERVAISAINGPKNTVISGDREAIQTIVQRLQAEGVTTHPMTVSHAFHSPLMDPMLDAFEQVARQITFSPLRIPLVSNLTGKVLNTGESVKASYWRQQTRNAVQFATSITTLAEQGYDLFVEIGPHPVLLNMGKRCLPEEGNTWVPSLRKGQDDWQALLECVATLYTKGVELDWTGFDRDYVRQRLALPTYPFEREHCWFELHRADTSVQPAPQTPLTPWTPDNAQRHPLLDSHLELTYPTGVHVWETALDKQRLPYLNDHRIQGAMAVPVSVYLEMAQAATVEVFGPGDHTLTEIELKKLLLLPEQGFQKVQVVFSSDANAHVSFHIYSHAVGAPDQPRSSWTLHATGKVRATPQ